MSKYAIEVHKLGKKYNIGKLRQQESFTLAHTLLDAFKQPARRIKNLVQGNSTGAADLDQEFWAVRDISFTVEHGETVGVIGHNGAGKSTLLKLLSRITRPSEGWAKINGRVGSLLEVGTGFNPELTGRENIYLNGSILGMQTQEITAKFDEIVEFYNASDFFKTLLENSMMSLTKSFFGLTAYMADDPVYGEFWKVIYTEYTTTKRLLLKLAGHTKLMENHPVGKASIEIRESIVLPLLTIQQFALKQIQDLQKSEGNAKEIEVYEKMVMRSLFGNINASRNSA